ncbi:hypothetical protein GCM10009665_06510 [Kitasatospora nipponensis]|uniref:SUKH-3 immunity protein of toxin-antitoxin system n=1 Tax=Kitasatospora nipponensis TaxID=258049 RepID=A0ABN1VTY2_9ACTN
MWRRRQNRAEGPARTEGEQAASALAAHLRNGGQLAPVEVVDVPLADGEAALADVSCWAARFYGTDIVYPRSAGYFENHPTFGRQWVPNPHDARRRREAEAAAEPQWRDHTPARLVLTTAGLRLRPSDSPDWLPFDHCLLTGLTAGPGDLVLSYSVCAPLLVAGPAASWLGVAIEHLRQDA